MRRMAPAALLGFILGPVRPVAAQTRAWPERIWFSISGGVQPTENRFSDTVDVPLYQETEMGWIDYPVKGGALVAASGGYRVWEQAALAPAGARSNPPAPGAVGARLVH